MLFSSILVKSRSFDNCLRKFAESDSSRYSRSSTRFKKNKTNISSHPGPVIINGLPWLVNRSRAFIRCRFPIKSCVLLHVLQEKRSEKKETNFTIRFVSELGLSIYPCTAVRATPQSFLHLFRVQTWRGGRYMNSQTWGGTVQYLSARFFDNRVRVVFRCRWVVPEKNQK